MAEIQMTRRIDDLGRVVIPKEIRRNLHLSEGEEMAFFVENDKLVLKKYSSLKCNYNLVCEVVRSIKNITHDDVIITDKNSVIISTNNIDKIPYEIFRIYENRSVKITDNKLFFGCHNFEIIMPIIVCGDIIGGIILLSKNNDYKRVELLKLSAEIISASIE